MLTVGFTLLFTALSSLCAAYVVKAVQFFKARQAERRKLRTPEGGRQLTDASSESESDSDLLELELLVRVTSSRGWWIAFQARRPPACPRALICTFRPSARASGRDAPSPRTPRAS